MRIAIDSEKCHRTFVVNLSSSSATLDAEDLLAAHAGAMDVCARGFIAAQKMTDDAALSQPLANRYADWAHHTEMLAGKMTLGQIAEQAEELDPQPVSGRQEILENIVNKYV